MSEGYLSSKSAVLSSTGAHDSEWSPNVDPVFLGDD